LHGAFSVHLPLFPPLAPAGLLPAVNAHSSVKFIGPALAGTVMGAEVQVPFGPPAGQGTATLLSVSDAVEQLSGVPPVPLKTIFDATATVQLEEDEMKFENVPLSAYGHAAEPLRSIVTSLACGATGSVSGSPGVPVFDQTRV
jgi:hypothetical protein